MEVNQLHSSDVIIFVGSGLLVIFLMVGFILYFLMSYRQKRKDYVLLEHQKSEIDRQKIDLENALQELKLTQAQLIQSEKMASMGELVAGIAHEIQNPLNFVNNFAGINVELTNELLEEIHNLTTDEIIDLAKMIVQNDIKIKEHGKRAEVIIKSMLEHSRSGRGQKETVSVNNLCSEYCKVAKEENKIKFRDFDVSDVFIPDPLAGNIDIMKQDVGRVLLNLIHNAYYAVHQKWIHSGKSKTYLPKVSVKTEKKDKWIVISIADNGIGIPDGALEKIFQPFFTTKPTGQGTGLGLSLANDIIKAHGGNIMVSSIENEGTEFLIQLPCNTE